MKYEYHHFSFSDNEEIFRLARKHDLRIVQLDIKIRPKMIGFEHLDDMIVCSLWHMNFRRGSIRKTKKAIKKFLRNYDKQNK